MPTSRSLLLLLLLPAVAHAHPEGHAQTGAFLQGLMHPLTGIDHLIFMLGLGIYAANLADRLRPWVGVAVLCGLIAGSGPSMDLPTAAIEAGVLGSLALMALAVVFRRALPAVFILPCAFLLSYVHGLAHQEAGFTGFGQAEFVTGLLLTSGALMAAGVLLNGKFRAPGWFHSQRVDRD